MISDKYSIFIILTITIISIMGVSTVLPALPEIEKVFHLNTTEVGLILTVFTLPGVFLAPLAGIIVDKYGRKSVLIPSLLLFGFSGIACAFAPSFHVLLLLRVIQGIGLSALNLLTNILITDMYKGSERTKMLGYNAMVLGFGTGCMPLLGGILAQFDWRFPFLAAGIAIPIAIASLFIHYMPLSRPSSLKVYYQEAKQAIASVRVANLFLLAFGTFLIVYGPIATYYPLYASATFSLPPLWIGVTYSAFALTTALATSMLSRLLRYTSSLQLMRFSHVTYIFSMTAFLLSSTEASLVIPLMLYGFAQGLNYPNLVTLVSGEATDTNRGIMLALQGMVFRLSQTLAPLLFGIAYTIDSFEGVYILGLIVSTLMLLISSTAIKEK
ncbi:MAG: MFS transporter [Desulfovibrionaceae bacterium]|nr:MFS transporter [Desulfovibrionaceae bacterium]